MRLWPRRKPYEPKLVPAVLPDAGPTRDDGPSHEIDPAWRQPGTVDPVADDGDDDRD